MSKMLKLDEFLIFYRKFNSIPTWTKIKHQSHSDMIEFFDKNEHIKVTLNYNSKSLKVHFVNHFSIFKVDNSQRGNLKIYRDKWVMMYCVGRHQTKLYLVVFPIKNDLDEFQSSLLANEFKSKYEKID